MVAVLASLVVASCGAAAAEWPLYSDTVVVDADGPRPLTFEDAGLALYPGTRVVVADEANLSEAELRLVDDHLRWAGAAVQPGAGSPYQDMVADAVLDLRALTLDNGAVVAGWHPSWRYVWPRDASFVAVAMAEVGHYDDALALLEFLAAMQHQDGWFEARYRPDGSGPPDDRGIQLDGTGWVLWASGEVVARMPASAQAAALDRLDPMIVRSSSALQEALTTADGLPPPSLDFWEKATSVSTLGTAAPWLAGARAAAELALLDGAYNQVLAMGTAADQLEHAIAAAFAPEYPRFPGGDQPDVSVAFLLPPFTGDTDPEIVTAWRRAGELMERPAGGLAPGAGWRQDGVSWTPQTALFALAAAGSGLCVEAEHWLDWLDAHRTSSGSLPEKVLADGRLASVAPLTWTAAVVILAVAEWDQNCHPNGAP